MASQGGPRLLIAAIAGGAIVRIMLGDAGILDALIIAILVFLRSFMEWALHSYVFDAAPIPLLGWRLHNPIAVMHGEHHRNPEKIEALFFGWKGVAAVLAASFAFLAFVFGSVAYALSGLIAVAVNLTLYEWCHVVSHSGVTVESPWFAAVIDNHRKHHRIDGRRNKGVSSVLADKVFGTY